MQEPKHDIKFTKSKINSYAFSVCIGEKKILYQILQLKDTILIFINEKSDLSFHDLSLAMENKYEPYPISTQLFGNFTNDASKAMAARACKTLNKCVYVSCNLEYDKLTFPYIEKSLYDQMKKCPEKF